MRYRFALLFFIFMLLVGIANSQSVLAEFEVPTGKISNIQSYIMRDTILLSVDTSDPKFQTDIKRFYLVGPDGNSKQFNTTLIGNSPLCGISRYDNDHYLYYLSGKRKNLILKAMLHNATDDALKLAEKEIEIGGALIGTWNDNGLFLIVYDKFSNQLKVLRINKMDVQSEKVFDLPFDFSKDYKGLSYIPESRFTSFSQASSKFKIYKIKNELILTVDLTLTELATKSQTTVVIINIESGEQTVKRFADNQLTYFRSFISNNKLYKASVSKNYFLLRIHDLATDSLIGKNDIVRDTTFKEIFVYRRIGADFRISHHKETLYSMMKTSTACLPSVVVTQEDSCNVSVIWGTYFNDKGVYYPGGLLITNPIAGIIDIVATNAIMQMREPPGISRYFYVENNCDRPAEVVENKNVPLRQLIDDYEISLDLKRVFSDYKGYFDYQNGGIGLYQGHRDDKNKLTLIKFDKTSSVTK